MSIYEYDEEKHMRQEREASLEEGKRIGREEGMRAGIQALVEDNLEEGKSKEVIIGKLMKRFALEKEEAEIYFEKCVK